MERAIEISQELIKKKSITPINDGAIEYLAKELETLGFHCEILVFEDVSNLYAKFGSAEKNFCFAGHTDVVPPGDESLWKFNPFSATIENGILYGRGAVDMKVAIAAFVAATEEFLNSKPGFKDSISFLITGDEEAIAINGTVKVIDWLKQNNEKISHCIVGEPTNPSQIGEMIKVGRRGSVNFTIHSIGKQGHVAYPENAINPVTALIKLLNLLDEHKFDEGNEYFDPTNLEITSIDVGNTTTNIIPETATANLNVRFNSEHTGQNIIDLIEYSCQKTLMNYKLEHRISGESFYNPDKFFSALVSDSVKNITKIEPKLSTTGGTSDARFIKNICPCVEFGLINKTAHQIDESIKTDEIVLVKNCYLEILKNYFK
jgi:succinyl-diaminopimelate desuccinylase